MKLHLPKQLFTALLAAITLAATPAAKGKEAFTNIDFTGDFYAKTYEFSFILNDGAVGGSVVGAYWGHTPANEYGANALTIVSVVSNADGSYTYTLGLGRGKLDGTNIDSSTTFTPKSEENDAITFTGTFESGVVYTISGLDGGSGDKHASASITQMASGSSIGAVGEEYYKNNMNGSDSTHNGVNSAYSVAGSSLVWSGSGDSAAIAASSQVDGVDILSNWKTATLTGTASSLANANLIFDASTVAKTVKISDNINVASIKVYDNYDFSATAATTLTTTSGLTIASGKKLTLEDNVTLSISSTIRGAGTLALDGGTLHIADCSTLDDLACTFSEDTDGFRTGFSATLTEGTISTSADASNITIEGGELTSYENGRLTATLNKKDIFYINTSRNYNDIKTSATGATGITVSSTGTLSIASSDTDWFEEGTFAAAVPVSNAGNIVLDCSVTEGDPKSVSLNSLFGDSAITQTSAGTTTISAAKAVSTSANLSTSGTVKISGAESFANNGNTLTLDKLVLENVTEATINGTGGETGKVSGTIEVLGKSKLILTGNHDLLGWSDGDYTDKILLRGTDAENKATLQLDTRQTCSTAIVMEGYSTILNGGNDAAQNSPTDNDAGILQMHGGGSITATGTDNTFSAILYTNKATSIAVTNTGDTLLIDGVVHGSSQITKTGDGTLTFSGDMAWQNGRINVNDGIVVLDDAATLGSSDYVVADGAELQVSGVTRETFSNDVSGTGTLTKTGAGTLTMDGNLSVSNVKATGGTLKLTGTLGTGTYTATGGNITLGSMTVNSGVQLNLASTNGHSINAESGSVITNNGTINLSGVYINSSGDYKGDTAFSDATKQFISLISSISGGQVQLHTGAFAFQLGGGSNAPTEVVFNAAYSNGGNLRLANYGETTQWKVGSNASLTVSGQLWLDHKQELNIDGGQVSATSMRLGYSSNENGSIINLSSGSLTTGTITLSGHKGTHKTAINMSGGELTFTNSTTLDDEGKVDISITGGTLKATSSDWTLTGSDTQVVSLGNAAIDIAAGKTVTLAGKYNLTGTLTLTGNTVTENETTTTGTLVLGGTMNVTDTGLLERGDGTYSGAASNVNGFFTGNYYLVKNKDNAAITTTGLSVTLGGEAVASENVSLSKTGNHLLLTGDSNGIFYVNSGEEVAKDSTVNTEGYVRHHVESKGVLVITPGANTLSTTNAQNALLATTGSGTISLGGELTIAAGSVSKATGKLAITSDATLTMDAGDGSTGGVQHKTHQYNLSSFTSVELDGGTIQYHGAATTLNNVTVTENGAHITFRDVNDLSNAMTLAGTTTLNGTLKLDTLSNDTTTTINAWKYGVDIARLTGSGTLDIHSTDYSGNTRQTARVSIQEISGFTGNILLSKHVGPAQLNLNNLSGTLVLNTIAMDGGAQTTLSVNADTEATMATVISGNGSVTKQGAGTLTLSGANTYTGATTVESGTLQVAGLSAISSSSSVSIGSGAELKYTGSGSETLSKTLSGAGSFTMAGTATLTVDTTLSHTGGTTIESGTLKQAGTNSVLGEEKNVTVKNGATLDVNGQEAYYNLTLGGGDAETAAVLTNTGGDVGDTKKQLYSITLADDATVTGTGGMCMIASSHGPASLNLAGNTLTKTGSNTFTISRATVSEGTIKVLQGKVLAKEAGSSGQDTGSLYLSAASVYVGNQGDSTGTFELDSVNQSVKDLTFDGGTVSTRSEKTLTATGTTQVKSTGGTLSGNLTATNKVSFENGGALKLGTSGTSGTSGKLKVQNADDGAQYIELSGSAGTAASMTAKTNSSMARLQADASFTIEDMTLTNTTITAATPTTQVNFRNVTVEGATVLRNMQASMTNANVGMGGQDGARTYTATTSLLSGITLNNKDVSGSTITVDLGDLAYTAPMGPSGKYDLTITLSGFTMQDYTQGIVFAADSWLGQLLSQSENADVQVSFSSVEAVAAAAESGAATGVTFSSGSVGTVITITGLNVPEPASATLGLAALMMLCARRRRKA